MRKGRDRGGKKTGGERKKKNDENSGHYVIASSRPPQRRPLEAARSCQLILPFIGLSKLPAIEQPPSFPNTEHRIIWSEDGILANRELLATALNNIQNNWKNPESPVSFSILLQCTNEAIVASAKLTN